MRHLRSFAATIFSLVLSTLLFTQFITNCKAADRPNVVWLISEDNSIHYQSMFFPGGASTPAIEALATKGLKFSNAFSNAPVCSVARTTLMTSCYGPRIGTQFHRKYVQVPMPDGVKMFPAYLRSAGYYTTNKQKKDYNAFETEGTWDESSRKASWRNRSPGQPFFHMQSFGGSHESSLHFNRKAFETKPTQNDPQDVPVAPYHPDTPLFRYTVAKYHDNIQAVDKQIGEVVSLLADDGLLEDTFIFYFGDHGGVLPRGKGYAYESGLHVPLVVRVPENWEHLVGWKRGSTVNGFVSFIDFGATVLNLAELEPPAGIDGKSFLGKGVNATEVESRQEAFGYADRFDEKYDLVRTLRKGKFTYIRNYQPFNFDGLQNNYRYRMLAYQQWRELFEAGQLNEIQSQFFRTRPAEQLFNIESDPHETINLAGEPEYQSTLLEMRNRLNEIVIGLPDLGFYPESYFAENAAENPVAFGQKRRQEIKQLVDIANLNTQTFADAKAGIANALLNPNAHARYWGLIVCSSFGKTASEFVPQAKLLLKDPSLLVRTRAAEFLALIGAAEPQTTIAAALLETESPIEAMLILNTVVLLRDGSLGYDFEITPKSFQPKVAKFGDVQRRLEYLDPK